MYTLSDEPCMILEAQTPQGWQCLDATRKYGTVGHLLNHAAPGKVTVKPYKPLMVMESGWWGFWLSMTCSQAQSWRGITGAHPKANSGSCVELARYVTLNPCIVHFHSLTEVADWEAGCINSPSWKFSEYASECLPSPHLEWRRSSSRMRLTTKFVCQPKYILTSPTHSQCHKTHYMKLKPWVNRITSIALHTSGVVRYALWGVSNHRTGISSSTPNIKK